jgi:hypothetical protein
VSTTALTPNPSATCIEDDDEACRRELLKVVLAGAGSSGLTAPTLLAIESIRRRLDEVLDHAVGVGAVEWWEGRAELHGQSYRRVGNVDLIARAGIDFIDIAHLLEARQTIEFQKRLSRSAARIAAVIAVLLVDLGREREAHAWFYTAELAAHESGDRALRGWLRTRRALACFYYGTPEETLEMARSAAIIAGRNPSVAAAMAPAVEARTLARMGLQREARVALRRSQQVHERLPAEEPASGLYAFPRHKLMFYTGNVLTRAGLSSEAGQAQKDALKDYPPADRVDPALIRLDQALLFVKGNDLEQASEAASSALVALPVMERGGTVLVQAREVANAMPSKFRGTQEYCAFYDLILGRAVHAHRAGGNK